MFFGFVFSVAGRTHRCQRLVIFALGVEGPGRCDLPLDIDDLRPIRVLCFAQLITQLGELRDVGFGGLSLTGTCRTECSRKMRHCIGIGDGAWPDLKLGRALPIAALYDVTRLARGASVKSGESLVTFSWRNMVDNRPSLRVPSELQVGIDQIVHSMHPIVPFLAGFRGPG